MALKIYLNELFNSRLRNFKVTLDYKKLTDDEIIASYFSNIGEIEGSTITQDVKSFLADFEYAKRSYEKEYSNYRIIYHSILNYTVPIAAQASIPVAQNIDFSKLQIVDLSNKN